MVCGHLGVILKKGVSDAAIQYGTTGKVDYKEVAISGAVGAVSSFIPMAGAGVESKIIGNAAKNAGKKVAAKLARIATEATMEGVVSSGSSVVSNMVCNPEKDKNQIIHEAKTAGITGFFMGSISSLVNNTIGEKISDKVARFKNSRDRAASASRTHGIGATNPSNIDSSAYYPKGVADKYWKDSIREYNRVFLEKSVY